MYMYIYILQYMMCDLQSKSPRDPPVSGYYTIPYYTILYFTILCFIILY